MRPRAIAGFELLWVLSLAMGVIQSAAGWRQLTMRGNMAFILGVQIITFSIILLLVLLVSRARRNFAKWILVILFVSGLPAIYQAFKSGHVAGIPVVSATQTLAQAVALILLFTPDARAWLRDRTRTWPRYG
jgi:hypothetical protein